MKPTKNSSRRAAALQITLRITLILLSVASLTPTAAPARKQIEQKSAPADASWTATGSMGTARRFHTATLLPNDKVLVAGGYNPSYLSSTKLHDPGTGT